MSSITVRNIEESVKVALRIRAARHGCSMEQEVRNILQQTLAGETAEPVSFAEMVNRRFKGLAVQDLPIPLRQAVRTPPSF
jgi:plasmid stability protein